MMLVATCRWSPLLRSVAKYGVTFCLSWAISASANVLSFVDGGALARSVDLTKAPTHLDRDLNVERLLAGHEVVAGEHVVILLREFKKDPNGNIDADEYAKLTVQFPRTMINKRIAIPNKDVKAYYSQGGSSWVETGSGWFGSDIRGIIETKSRADGKLDVTIEVRVRARNAQQLGERRVVRIRKAGSAVPVQIPALTPWLGQVNSSSKPAATRDPTAPGTH